MTTAAAWIVVALFLIAPLYGFYAVAHAFWHSIVKGEPGGAGARSGIDSDDAGSSGGGG
jgi:hypothetical protein